MSWAGVTDRDALARVFVAVAALFHFVSVALAVRAAAAPCVDRDRDRRRRRVPVPSGDRVGPRVGNGERPLRRHAARLHALFPSRVPAAADGTHRDRSRHPARLDRPVPVECSGVRGLLVARRLAAGRSRRVPAPSAPAAAAGFCAGAIVLVYLLANYFTTGHFQPISAEAKALGTRQYLDSLGIDSRLSLAFVKAVSTRPRAPPTGSSRRGQSMDCGSPAAGSSSTRTARFLPSPSSRPSRCCSPRPRSPVDPLVGSGF